MRGGSRVPYPTLARTTSRADTHRNFFDIPQYAFDNSEGLRSRMLKMLSLAGYLGMMGGLLSLLFLHALFSRSPIVIGLQIVALLLFLWSRITFGLRSYHVGANPTKGGLVTSGPYRFVRHPIYATFCLFTAAGACLLYTSD